MTRLTAATLSNCYVPVAASSEKETLSERQKRLVASRSSGEEDFLDTTTASANTQVAVRGPAALRRLCLETSVLSKCDGSALVELGHTKVLAQIVGPTTETTSANESSSMEEGVLQCQVKYAPHVGIKPESVVGNAVTTLDAFQLTLGKISSLTSTKEADLTLRLHNAFLPAVPLQQYPKCIFTINVTVLQDDGSVLSAAIVATSLALADANVECYDLVSSCTVAVFSDNKEQEQTVMLADPTEDELDAADATVVLAVMPNWKEVTLWQQSGKLSPKEASQAVDLCRDGCRTLQRFMRQCLVDRIERKGGRSDQVGLK